MGKTTLLVAVIGEFVGAIKKVDGARHLQAFSDGFEAFAFLLSDFEPIQGFWGGAPTGWRRKSARRAPLMSFGAGFLHEIDDCVHPRPYPELRFGIMTI